MKIKNIIRLTCIVLCMCLFFPAQLASANEFEDYRFCFDPESEGFGVNKLSYGRSLLERVFSMESSDDYKAKCTLWFADYERTGSDDTAAALQQYKDKIASQLNIPVEDIHNNDEGICYYSAYITKRDFNRFKKESLVDNIIYNSWEVPTVDIPHYYYQKIDDGYLDAFMLDWKIPDDKRIPTAIRYKDPYSSAHDEEYTQELNDRVAQFDRSDYTSDEWRSLVSCLETRVRREIAMKCNADMAETFDLPKENIVKTDFGRNLIWAYLNKDETRKLLDNEYITNINYEEMIEPQSWNDDTCISRELLQRFDGSDKKYNVVITVGFRSSKEYYRDQFFEWMRWTQEKSEKFADTYLADKDTRCIGKVIYVELTEKEIRGLDWVHQVIGTISDIDLAENLSMNDVPVYEEYFEDIEDLFEASDSMKIQRMVVGLDKYEYSERYDVDSDGKLSNRDAMYILRSTISLENISPEFRYKHKIMNFYKDLGIQTYDDSYYPTA